MNGLLTLTRKNKSPQARRQRRCPAPPGRDDFADAARRAGRDPAEWWAERKAENPAQRFGDPEEFGLACAFLCGARSDYITGQNLLIDGGAYPGTL